MNIQEAFVFHVLLRKLRDDRVFVRQVVQENRKLTAAAEAVDSKLVQYGNRILALDRENKALRDINAHLTADLATWRARAILAAELLAEGLFVELGEAIAVVKQKCHERTRW